MTTNNQQLTVKQTIKKYYDLINVQIAAEAMTYNKDRSDEKQIAGQNPEKPQLNEEILYEGNSHSTRFPSKEAAADFLAKYKMVEHQENTTSGSLR